MKYRKIESDDDVNTLVKIAHEIWNHHFKSMFDSKTLCKLIEAAQSKKTILSKIEQDYQYFFIIDEGEKIGYFAYKINPSSDELFLSKIYIYSNKRGQGVGREVLGHLETLCHDAGIRKIVLTVYHGNIDSIKAYENWGFTNLGLIERIFDDDLVFMDVKMEKVFN